MYLLLLGVIAVGAGLLLVYYSLKDKKKTQVKDENWEPEEKGKVIYLFDEENDNSGFVDPKPEKPEMKSKDEKKDPADPEKDDDK